MAADLPQEVAPGRAVSGAIGRSLLDVLTSGMYSDPRMALREYVQNSVDSIDVAAEQGLYTHDKPRVLVTLDGRDRNIIVEDNGVGVSADDLDERLGSLGCSSKSRSSQRGFRGIGRLGGLAYCDVLRFETRRSGREPVHIVEWNGHALRDQVDQSSGHEKLRDAVRRVAKVGSRHADRARDPDRFFRVVMKSVHRFHSDVLMNVKSIREYLSQTAPVPFSGDEFSFAQQVEEHLRGVTCYRAYSVLLNNTPVVRPYRDVVVARKGMEDRIREVELIQCQNRDGLLLARGWFGRTGFLSALPNHVPMRGLRVRQGNIAVGDEYILKDLFSESRFATWHIGELHVTPRLKLNARRDGFEESVDYEDFLEWANVLCRRLSGLCRQSSKHRSTELTVGRLSDRVERSLSVGFFVDEEHARAHIAEAKASLARLRKLLGEGNSAPSGAVASLEIRLAALEAGPVFLRDLLDGRVLRSKDNKELLLDLCKKLLAVNGGHVTWDVLTAAVGPYLRPAAGVQGRMNA